MLVFKRQVQQLVQIRHGYNHRNATEAAKLSIDRSIAAQIGERQTQPRREREREMKRKVQGDSGLDKEAGQNGQNIFGQ
jgi:hypothetical protein